MAEVRPLHRASSPSAQSSSRYTWTSTAAAIALARPPTATTAPAATPHTMNPAVTAFGGQPRRAKIQVAPGDTRRM